MSFYPLPNPQPFGSVLNLIPLAESVVKLKAVCMVCFRDAAFTKRLGTEKEVGPSLMFLFDAHLTFFSFDAHFQSAIPGRVDWWYGQIHGRVSNLLQPA